MPVTLTLDEAAAELHAGHVVAVPTESVYGLTADPTQENALRALLALKARDPSKGFILVASTIEALNDWIEPFTPDMATRILPTSHIAPGLSLRNPVCPHCCAASMRHWLCA